MYADDHGFITTFPDCGEYLFRLRQSILITEEISIGIPVIDHALSKLIDESSANAHIRYLLSFCYGKLKRGLAKKRDRFLRHFPADAIGRLVQIFQQIVSADGIHFV